MKISNADNYKFEIFEEYKKGRSLNFLVEKYKSSKNYISKLLRDAGIKLRKRHERVPIAFHYQEEIVLEYISGASQGELVKKYKAAPKTIKEILKMNNITERPLGHQSRKEFSFKNGYRVIPMPDDYPKKGGVGCRLYYEHILNYEKHINRILIPKKECLHHIDLNKLNNNIDNLFLCNKKTHSLIHNQLNQIVSQLILEKVIIFDSTLGEYRTNIS